MISISGLIHDIIPFEQTDRQTGEVKSGFKAEILHKSNGKSEISSFKLDPSVVEEWRKVQGHQMSVEVRFGAMPGSNGKPPILFMTLADSKSLPVLARPAHQSKDK